MFHPAHIDGRTLVILRRQGLSFRIVASGRLTYDGDKLELVSDAGSRQAITEAQLASLLHVTDNNRIKQCRGFDFFLIEEAAA